MQGFGCRKFKLDGVLNKYTKYDETFIPPIRGLEIVLSGQPALFNCLNQ